MRRQSDLSEFLEEVVTGDVLKAMLEFSALLDDPLVSLGLAAIFSCPSSDRVSYRSSWQAFEISRRGHDPERDLDFGRSAVYSQVTVGVVL